MWRTQALLAPSIVFFGHWGVTAEASEQQDELLRRSLQIPVSQPHVPFFMKANTKAKL
jgi:hypothetical protein